MLFVLALHVWIDEQDYSKEFVSRAYDCIMLGEVFDEDLALFPTINLRDHVEWELAKDWTDKVRYEDLHRRTI